MPTNPLRIQLFGPVRVRRGREHLLLGGVFRRAIVARLALVAGEPVSTDELVAGLWPQPPAAAVSSLRAQVSRLRQGELGGVVGGGRGGYVLDPQGVEIDAAELRGLAATGADAPRTWQGRLTAGAPLADLDGFPFVPEARERLAEQRVAAVEAFAGNRLADGDPREALGALTSLLAMEKAARESTIVLAAEASARLGRASEALELLDGISARESPIEMEMHSIALPLRAGGMHRVAVQERPVDLDIAALREAIVRHDPAVSPPRTADLVARRGIPLPISSFVGRSDELAAVHAARRSSRLITLVGPGGVGKTRLAIESARRVAHPEDDEQWMIDLTVLDRADGLPDLLAECLGGTRPDRVSGNESVLDAVAERLAGRRVLLVLDNAEHLRQAVAALAIDLLARCPGLTVLVTTREALRVPGEKLIPVEPMSVDDSGDAVALFEARARDVVPGFDASADLQRSVRAICARLDGLPLALELAAARLDVLDLDELRAAIEQDGLLRLHPNASTGDRPHDRGRHADLRATLDWSIDLLSRPERLLLRQLAWFAGAFDLDAVDAICASEHGRPRDLVLALARKSLVAVDSTAGRRHYRLLQSVRQALLEPGPEPDCPEVLERWRRRHTLHYASWVLALDDRVRSPEARELHARLDAARPDLQLAFETAVGAADRENALRLAGGQAWHWFRRGSFVRARHALDRAFAIDGAAHPDTVARACLGAVMNIHRSGDEFGGERYAFEGAEAAGLSGDPTWRSLFAACTGMWRATVGDVAGHDERMRVAVGLLDEVAPWAVSEVHLFRGIAKGYLEQPAQALEAFAEAHRTARACGHRWAVDAAALRLAHLYIKLRRGRDAVSQVRAAVRGAVTDGDMHAVVTTLHTGAGACALLERHGDGAALLGVVDTVAQRFGYDRRSVEPAYWSGYRDRVRQGLTPATWRREYARGTRLGIGDAIRLLEEVAS
ncbi:AAA family ATPase [Herbiconiux moechotypicola]|uniref:AfsR/SARP family transcriptional regulator n=1 Tax=Herbiconiux moechotypicola TaxID=637393 RepID=UPI00217F0789|nr:AAA family ATPase [Herbiconiux moechotypicola]MCS5731212.1 AAA family ATPase [Herbiconiux moechotypicola]